MDNATEYRRLAVIMVTSFAATFGYLYWRDHRGPAAVDAPAPVTVPSVETQTPAERPAASGEPRATARPAVAPQAPEPAPTASPHPPEEPVTQPGADPAPGVRVLANAMAEGRRRVRLFNPDETTVQARVRILRGDLLVGERHVEIPFNQQVQLGVDDGIEIHGGDKVLVDSDLGQPLLEQSIS